MSNIKQESFIQDVSVIPSAAAFGANNQPVELYTLKFTLKQTTLMLLSSSSSSYEDEQCKTTTSALLFRANRFKPQEFNPVIYDPCCKLSSEVIRYCLKHCLRLSTLNQDVVIDKILNEIRINDGYNHIRPITNNCSNIIHNHRRCNYKQKEVWPRFVRLDVIINQVNLTHVFVSPLLQISLKKKRMEECCSVCLEELDDNKQALTSMCCGHVFHYSCIVNWLAAATSTTALTCPLCRTRVPSGSLFAPAVQLD